MKMTYGATAWVSGHAGLAFLVVLAVLLAGCGGEALGGRQKVRVGFIPEVGQAVPLVGYSRERGVFEKDMPDLSLQHKAFRTGAEVVAALRAGDLDMAFVGPAPVITAFWERGDIVILAGSTSGGDILLARPGAKVASVTDLSGKTVAVRELGSTEDVLLRFQMALNGLRSKDAGGKVDIQAMEGKDIVAKLVDGQIDAACVSEPWASRLEREAGATVLLGSAEIFNEGRYPGAVLVARKDFAEANPATVQAFADSAKNLAEAVGKDPESYVSVLAREIRSHSGDRVTEEEVRRSLKRCRFTPQVTQHEVHVFANLIEVAGYKQDMTASLDGVLWRPTP